MFYMKVSFVKLMCSPRWGQSHKLAYTALGGAAFCDQGTEVPKTHPRIQLSPPLYSNLGCSNQGNWHRLQYEIHILRPKCLHTLSLI